MPARFLNKIMLSIITLPEGFVGNITATMSSLFTDLSGYITLILGVVLGAIIIDVVIGAIRK